MASLSLLRAIRHQKRKISPCSSCREREREKERERSERDRKRKIGIFLHREIFYKNENEREK